MPNLTTTPDQWLERAAAATDSLDFDVCVTRGLPFFDGELNRVETARQTMFGSWKPEQAKAMLEGLNIYAAKRQELEHDGLPTLSAHQEAKQAAIAAYRRAVGRMGATAALQSFGE